LFCSLTSSSQCPRFLLYRYSLFVHSSSHPLLLPGQRSFSEHPFSCHLSSNLSPLESDGARTGYTPTAIALCVGRDMFPRVVCSLDGDTQLFYIPLWARCRGMKSFPRLISTLVCPPVNGLSLIFFGLLCSKQCSFRGIAKRFQLASCLIAETFHVLV